MRTRDVIINKLREAFLPESLDVTDESHLHEGHAGHRPGGETHFRVYIVSPAFEGNRAANRFIWPSIACSFMLILFLAIVLYLYVPLNESSRT